MILNVVGLEFSRDTVARGDAAMPPPCHVQMNLDSVRLAFSHEKVACGEASTASRAT